MLTKNELKKALECCQGDWNCVNCPYNDKCSSMHKDALEYFNNLEAENERLQKVNDSLDVIGRFYSELKADIYKEVEEKIEGLTWYHIGKRGKLVMGANGETDIPLYKAEDIYNLLNELIGKSAE